MRSKPSLRQATFGEKLKGSICILLWIFCIPILLIRVFTLIFGMRYLAIPEVIHTELLYKAKNIAVNIILALVLMLRMSTFAASLNFFDHYWGIAIFSFFAANFNTEENAWIDAKQCWKSMFSVTDLVENNQCRRVLIPAYLYTLTALCVALLVLEVVIRVGIFLAKHTSQCLCPKDRGTDLQVLKLEAQRALQYDVEKKFEQEGNFQGLGQSHLQAQLHKNPDLLEYDHDEGEYVYTPQAVDHLHQIIKLSTRGT